MYIMDKYTRNVHIAYVLTVNALYTLKIIELCTMHIQYKHLPKISKYLSFKHPLIFNYSHFRKTNLSSIETNSYIQFNFFLVYSNEFVNTIQIFACINRYGYYTIYGYMC